MKALSDSNRVKVLKMLEGRELCVCEIQPLLGLSQSTVSKHLKALEDAGLVDKRKEGQWVIYRLSNGAQSVYARSMLANLAGWLKNDQDVREMLRHIPLVRRSVCKK